MNPVRHACSLILAAGLALAGCRPVAVQPSPYSTSSLLAAALEDDAVLLVDVRSAAEYAHGHIPGAINIPHSRIADRLDELPVDRDIVLYCRSGHRVHKAMKVLAAHGYTRVYSFGWLDRWEGELER